MPGPQDIQSNLYQDDPLVGRARSALHAGQKDRAYALLLQFARRHPEHGPVWLWLAQLAPDARQARAWLRRALAIDPRNHRAIHMLRALETRLADKTPVQTPAPTLPLRRWLGIWLIVGVLVVIAGGFVSQSRASRWQAEPAAATPPVVVAPTATATWTPTPDIPTQVGSRLPALEQAWGDRDWPGAIRILNQIATLDGAYPGLAQARCDTYLQWARDLAAGSEIKAAYERYRQAGDCCPDPTVVEHERSLALSYLAGEWRHGHQLWEAAGIALRPVYEADADYAQVRVLLYEAYLFSAQDLLSEDRLHQARQAAQAALDIEPGSSTAQELLDQTQLLLAPTPTPTPPPVLDRRIEVNLSEQRMYVWQDEQLVYKWVCSTGEPGRETAAGHFQILDKLPEAWASTWSLRMPHWMGIYWAGTLENGIHALPINPDGSLLWDGYLGSRVSYGCVILSTQNARTLYNWAPIGTPVWIHY